MLRAGFLGTTTVMDMLEANYCTWRALNPEEAKDDGIPVLESTWNGIEDDNEAAESENGDEKASVNDGDDMSIEEEDVTFQSTQETTKNSKTQQPQQYDDDIPLQPDQEPPLQLTSKRKRRGEHAQLVKQKVERVFEETGLGEKRARMCDQGDFLKLLWAFNKAHIHFS